MTRPGTDSRRPEDRLEGEVELSRLYREDAEPPAELDERVLAAARRAVGAGPGRHRRFGPRWAPALAVAAVLVLAVSVVSLLPRQYLTPVPDTVTHERLLKEESASPMRNLGEGFAPPEAEDSALGGALDLQEPRPSAAATPAPEQDGRGVAGRARAPSEPASRRAEPKSIESREHAPLASEAADPEVWRKRIATLLERGDSARAARELAAFREAYPDYPKGELERRLEELDP